MSATEEMRVVLFPEAGGPETIRLSTRPVPKPGPGQVLIEVVAFGLNRGDCLQRAGIYPPPPGESDIPGLEVSGRIVSSGEGAGTFKIGDEVCALVASGAYAEFCIAEAVLCHARPSGISLVDAAGIPEAAYTAFDNVFTRGRLSPGETLLVHGGSSGVGSMAIQLAHQHRARVIVTAGSETKCDFCSELGADLAINYRDEDFVEAARRFTGERGVDVILDCVGGPYTAKNISLLALEGRLVQVYFMQGSVLKEFDYLPIMLRRLTLTGSTLRPRTLAQKAQVAGRLNETVFPLYVHSALKSTVNAIFPMTETAEAHALMESSRHLGKIVIETGR